MAEPPPKWNWIRARFVVYFDPPHFHETVFIGFASYRSLLFALCRDQTLIYHRFANVLSCFAEIYIHVIYTYPGEWGRGVEKSNGVSRNEWNFVEYFLFFFPVLNLGFFFFYWSKKWIESRYRKRGFLVFWFWGNVKRKISGRNLDFFFFYRRMERLFCTIVKIVENWKYIYEFLVYYFFPNF